MCISGHPQINLGDPATTSSLASGSTEQLAHSLARVESAGFYLSGKLKTDQRFTLLCVLMLRRGSPAFRTKDPLVAVSEC